MEFTVWLTSEKVRFRVSNPRGSIPYQHYQQYAMNTTFGISNTGTHPDPILLETETVLVCKTHCYFFCHTFIHTCSNKGALRNKSRDKANSFWSSTLISIFISFSFSNLIGSLFIEPPLAKSYKHNGKVEISTETLWILEIFVWIYW